MSNYNLSVEHQYWK